MPLLSIVCNPPSVVRRSQWVWIVNRTAILQAATTTEWKMVVNLWDTTNDGYKVKCEKKIKNRKELKASHIRGMKIRQFHEFAKMADELTQPVDAHGEDTPERVLQAYVARSVVVREDKKLLTVLFPDGLDGQAFTLKAETIDDLFV
ncbi:hypothetical protein OROGR_003717 [Orobanche gracilis]